MATKRIRIEVHGNSNIRSYHANTTISAEQLRSGLLGADRRDPFRTLSFGEEEKELSDDTKATVMRFYDIDGVAAVGLDTSMVKIDRSVAYDWEEIEDDILAAITEIAGWDMESVEVEWLFAGRRHTEPITREAQEAEAERQRTAYERESAKFGGLF